MFGRVLVFPSATERTQRRALTSHSPLLINTADTAPNRTWVRDPAHARALQDSTAGVSAFALLVTRERDVRRRVAILEPYCAHLWRALPVLDHPELLECVFWGDRLTVALVAARDCGAALVWCTCIARLPPRARLDAAPGLRRRVARRAARCRHMLRTRRTCTATSHP